MLPPPICLHTNSLPAQRAHPAGASHTLTGIQPPQVLSTVQLCSCVSMAQVLLLSLHHAAAARVPPGRHCHPCSAPSLQSPIRHSVHATARPATIEQRDWSAGKFHKLHTEQSTRLLLPGLCQYLGANMTVVAIFIYLLARKVG